MHQCRAFHLQALSLFKDAAEYDGWLRQIKAPVLAIAGDKDALTPMVGPGNVALQWYCGDSNLCRL